MPDFVLYSTSNTHYQSWQCDLLEYSYLKSGQKGELICLCSEGENNELPERTSDIAKVIQLPSYMKNPKTGDFWGIANKLGSLDAWIGEQKEEGSVLFLDPDMVFIQTVDTKIPMGKVEEGKVFGQRWIDPGIPGHPIFDKYCKKNRDRINASTIFMYPYVMHTADIRKTMARYYELSHEIRDKEKKWESDMYALVIVAAEFGLEVETIDDLGVCNNWEEYNQQSTPIVHFPGPFLDKDGKKIWFKQDFTEQTLTQPWSNLPNPLDAKSQAECSTLALLKNHVNSQLIKKEKLDYLYWKNLPCSLGQYAVDQDKYIIFDQYPGGFNNIRMSLELAAVFALLLDRVLVLPPRTDFYLLNGECGFEDFFDLSELGIHTISFEQFCTEKSIAFESLEDAWSAIANKSFVADWDVVKDLVVVPAEPRASQYFHDYKVRRDTISFSKEALGSESIYFPQNLLGSFYLTIFAESRLKEMTEYVAKHIHYHEHMFLEAYNLIEYLGDRNYAAVHIRRNDFQYKDLFITGEALLKNISPALLPGERLYIATDADDKSFLKPLEDVYEVIYFSDLEYLVDNNMADKLIGCIEQLVCSRARVFIGTRLSTFSSYIYRLRGYMDDIYETSFYDNTLDCKMPCYESNRGVDKSTGAPTWTHQWQMTWGREFSEAWAFKNENVFVSIASYRDPDIENTIKNLLENADDRASVVVGVCLQESEERLSDFLFTHHKNIRVIKLPFEEAKGPCYARSRIQKELFQGEKYYLQVDSHSRFSPGWDSYLKNNLISCKSPKPILTTYPNGFSPNDQDQSYLKDERSSSIVINKFDVAGYLRVRGEQSIFDTEPVPGDWLAAGFVFTFGDWIKEVPYDDGQYFSGEEDALLIRSYTQGWDTFVPPKNVVFHDYNDNRMQSETKVRPLHWEDHEEIDNGFDILRALHKGVGTGTQRTIEDFQRRYGVNFETREVKPWPIEQTQELLLSQNTRMSSPKRMEDARKNAVKSTNKNFKVLLDTEVILDAEYQAWIFCLFDTEGEEVYRTDITDEEITAKRKRDLEIKINIETLSYPIVQALIWPMIRQGEFSDRHEYPVNIDLEAKLITRIGVGSDARSETGAELSSLSKYRSFVPTPAVYFSLVDYSLRLETKGIKDSHKLWVVCLFDEQGREVFREDLYDQNVLSHNQSLIKISVDGSVDMKTVEYALIWPMFEDGLFDERYEFDVRVDEMNKLIFPSGEAKRIDSHRKRGSHFSQTKNQTQASVDLTGLEENDRYQAFVVCYYDGGNVEVGREVLTDKNMLSLKQKQYPLNNTNFDSPPIYWKLWPLLENGACLDHLSGELGSGELKSA